MIKESIQEEDITIVNIYAPNIGAPQNIRQILTAIKKGEINSNTIIVGYFRLVQDGGGEGCALPPVRTPESQLTAEQSSTGRHWKQPKKIPHIQRQRRSHNETVEGAQSQ